MTGQPDISLRRYAEESYDETTFRTRRSPEGDYTFQCDICATATKFVTQREAEYTWSVSRKDLERDPGAVKKCKAVMRNHDRMHWAKFWTQAKIMGVAMVLQRRDELTRAGKL